MFKVYLRTCLYILALSVWLVSSKNVTRVNSTANLSTSTIKSPLQPQAKEAFEEYEGGDRELLFDNFKIYEDGDNIEKGIRKLDTSVENGGGEKLEAEVVKNDKPLASNSTATVSPKTSEVTTKLPLLQPAETKVERRLDGDVLNTDSEEQTIIFEDSEVENRKPNVSGTLVTKLIPEILKYNGRMVLPSSEEQPDPDHRRGPKTASVKESGSVVQKLTPRRVRHESHNRVKFVAAPTSKSSFQLSNISRLEEIFDLYNPYRLLEIWNDNEELEALTPECRSQMHMYLVALRAGQSWAIKSESLFYLVW
ncbi:hypothetical protein V9T40_001414 [Parthenolecanium corni]|uniref:Uncharacterized protein n=1 Tax=Parthenolecanium corni TaxID=536013 RepID=A0AAN9TBG4_9HEMI